MENTQVRQLERSTYHLLKRAAQHAANLYVDKVGKNGLTQRQFAVLLAVNEYEGVSQTKLVAMTGIDRSTMADLVGRLIAQGYVRRKRDKNDARRNVLKLTAAGKRALETAEPGVASVDRKLSNLIPKEHRKSFRAALKILSDLQKD
jgi:DNA-binding MarR family transcriptional regulator